MSKLYYGATTKTELLAHIRRACRALSLDTASNAIDMLIGTACTESHLGAFPDTSEGYGFSFLQFDRIRVEDVKRYIERKHWIANIIREETGLDIDFYDTDTLCHILKFSPLVAAFFGRVAYMMKPEPLPEVGDLDAQAKYYKTHWNTDAGKASVEKYKIDYKKYYAGGN